MSKASDYAKTTGPGVRVLHSWGGGTSMVVAPDGNAEISVNQNSPRLKVTVTFDPEMALTLGKWLVENYEEKP